MIRKHKRFRKPRKMYDAERIKSEGEIVEKYGLKNRREIWKAREKLSVIRRQAKRLMDANEELQAKFLAKINNMGFKISTPVEVLAISEEDILKRRLQTVLVTKGIATTPKKARQLITHKHILVENGVVNSPSYLVPAEKENMIELKNKMKKEQNEKIISIKPKQEKKENE